VTPGNLGKPLKVQIPGLEDQDYLNGGNGYLRIMRFSPANNKIFVETYSPMLEAYLTDAANEFELDYDMLESFEEIGKNTVVGSGLNTTMGWPGLEVSTDYEWYVTATDGLVTTNGRVWSFTTIAGLAGDFNGDCDVDGEDLSEYNIENGGLRLSDFAADFGKSNCP